MSVEAGAPENFNVEQKLQRQTMEERRLAEMMIPKKKKRLYDKIMYAKKKKNQEVRADKLVQTSCCRGICVIADLYHYFLNFTDKETKRKTGGHRDAEEV